MSKLKSAFSLIELLIVVIIISVAYGLVITNMTRPTETIKNINLKNIKKKLFEIKKETLADSVKIVCTEENCKKCELFIDGEAQEGEITLFSSIPTVHYFDKTGYFTQKEVQYRQKCFEYEIFSNGTCTKMLLEYRGEYYIYYPYLKEVEIYADFDEAKRMYDPKEIIPTESNQYYAF